MVQLGSTWFNSIHLNSIKYNLAQLGSTRFNSVQLDSTQFNLVQPSSTWFNSIRLGSTFQVRIRLVNVWRNNIMATLFTPLHLTWIRKLESIAYVMSVIHARTPFLDGSHVFGLQLRLLSLCVFVVRLLKRRLRRRRDNL